jgi:hypothetical protein
MKNSLYDFFYALNCIIILRKQPRFTNSRVITIKRLYPLCAHRVTTIKFAAEGTLDQINVSKEHCGAD